MKCAAKRFLLNKSNSEQNAPQLQASCQSHLQARPIELIITQIAPQIEDVIHARDIVSAKTIFTYSSKKAGYSSIDFEQIIPPICKLQVNLIRNLLISSKVKNFINLIKMPGKSKQQNTPTRMHFDEKMQNRPKCPANTRYSIYWRDPHPGADKEQIHGSL